MQMIIISAARLAFYTTVNGLESAKISALIIKHFAEKISFAYAASP